MTRPLTLLISSAGSYLGHNILDALEPYRAGLRVIGINADADNPRLFRCDRVYLVPRIEETAAFEQRLEEVIASEQPDLIIPGRDHDVVALAHLKERRPDLAARIPCGPVWLADMMQDKLATWNFARECGVPFAETIATDATANQLADFTARYGFPMIAKPCRGFGSLGVRILFSAEQLEQVLQLPGYVLQPFLAPASDLAAQVPDFSGGVPFFFGFRDDRQFAGQTLIAPDGEFVEPCLTISHMVLGRPERSELWPDPRLREVMCDWTRALARAGWRGSFNFQCRQLPDGSYVGFELNGRMSGSSSARCHFGFHEPRMLVERFVAPDAWPRLGPSSLEPGYVSRSLSDGFVSYGAVARLREEGEWTSTPSS